MPDEQNWNFISAEAHETRARETQSAQRKIFLKSAFGAYSISAFSAPLLFLCADEPAEYRNLFYA